MTKLPALNTKLSAPSSSQREPVLLPSTVQNPVHTVNSLPVLPPFPVWSVSQDTLRISPNPFLNRSKTINSVNPFSDNLANAGNPFKNPTSSLPGPTPMPTGICERFHSTSQPELQQNRPVFTVGPAEKSLSLPHNFASMSEPNPQGWITFDDDHFSTNSNWSASNGVQFDGFQRSTFDSNCNPIPAGSLSQSLRKPPPPPCVPSRTKFDPSTKISSHPSPTLDFTDR